MKVIVLGAGVIGVTSAYFLAREGHQVTVIDKNPAPAMSCSYANGGQLSYSHIETWAQSTSAFTIFKSLVNPSSFLSFSDLYNKKFWCWLWKFYRNSSEKSSYENSKNLFALSSYSREIMKQVINAESNLKFDYKNQGILHFFRDKKKYEKAIQDLEFQRKIGCNVQVLTAEECVKKEPNLVKLLDEQKLAGGIFYEDDASGNCAAFTSGLEKICREKYGVEFLYETEIKNILTNHKKVTGINTSDRVFTANKYVYALGAPGVSLLNGVGVEPQIYPLKGYSLSIPTDAEFVAPNLALTDPENKIVYSRIGNVFRAAGSVEICGLRANKNGKNLDFLKTTIRKSFSDFGNLNKSEDWFGFRPFRPNSLPLICEVKKYGNLLINSGQGSLGWTLAAASGKILSDLVSDKKDEKFSFLEEEEKQIYIK
jgi:D-amino-acid dehydrogenase